jgi:hypothetical protein
MTTHNETLLPVEDARLERDADAAGGSHNPGRREQSGGVAQGPAPTNPEEVPHPEVGTPYLPRDASSQAHERWAAIQAEFVDDPRRSVADAHQLVGDLMQQIVDAFAAERGSLEKQWSQGHAVSTEDLRLCLQRYRAFFARLLPAMPYDKQR